MESENTFSPTVSNQFVCICPTKAVECSVRAQEEQGESGCATQSCSSSSTIKHYLDTLDFDGLPTALYTLQGAGIATPRGRDCPTVFQGETLLSAFSGHLENYSYLIKKYCPETLNVLEPQKLRLEEIRQRRPVSEAQMVCILYHQLGSNMVPKLRGRFAFVLYNARQMRVLAANDNKGSFKVQQAFMPDGSLVITCGDCMPPEARDLVTIQPGCMKYGWHAPPSKYSSTEDDRKNAAKQARDAAVSALAGLSLSQPQSTDEVKKGMILYNQHIHEQSITQQQVSDTKINKHQRYQSWSVEPDHNAAAAAATWDKMGGIVPILPLGAQWLGQLGGANDTISRRNSYCESIGVGGSFPLSPFDSDSSRATSVRTDSAIAGSSSAAYQESVAALSALPKFLLDRLAGGDTAEDVCLASVTDLLLNTDMPIVLTDAALPDNPVIYVNPVFVNATGYTLSHVIGTNLRFMQASPGKVRTPSFTSMLIRRNLEVGGSSTFRIINFSRLGQPMWNDITLTPVSDNQHNISHWLAILKFTPANNIQNPPCY